MKFESKALATLMAFVSLTGSLAFVNQPRSNVVSSIRKNTIPTAFGLETSDDSLNLQYKTNTWKKSTSTSLQMAEDDEDDDEDSEDDVDDEYDPLKNGVASVSWLPSLSEQVASAKGGIPAEIRNGAEILPLFPLGGMVYTPNSEHVLNIFEPRYRQMYTDILMNGSKRFIVSMSHPEKEGTFATTGVIFYLNDLKEVSEETGDAIKYICNHRVTKRVQLHTVLNPEAWTARDTYLKVEATILDEGDDEEISGDEDLKDNDIYKSLVGAISDSRPKTKEEKELSKTFSNLVEKQHELEEDVRFTRASVETLAVAPGNGGDGLWATIRLWQSFIEQRLVSRQNEMQMEFQEKLLAYLKKEKGISDKELPSAIGFDDLSPALQKEVQDLQKRMSVELQPMVLESTLAIQKILEAEDHTARCELLKHFVESEKKRLETKGLLKGMFAPGGGSGLTVEDDEIKDAKEEKDKMVADIKASLEEAKKDDKGGDNVGGSGSLIMDDEDAFQ